MKPDTGQETLRHLLDLADGLVTARKRQGGAPEGDAPARVPEAGEREVLIREVSQALERGDLPGTLGQVVRKHKLDTPCVTVLLALLKRRINHSNAYLEGRYLLALLFESTYDMLRGTRILEADGVLRRAGLIVPGWRGPQLPDVFEIPFKLADNLFDSILRDVTRGSGTSRRPAPTPYESNLDYLMDLRGLLVLYQMRSSQVFGVDWTGEGEDVPESLEGIQRRIEEGRRWINTRLDKTSPSTPLPAYDFTRAHRLAEDELMIVMALLFQEALAGEATTPVAELVKLASDSEAEVLEKRHLFAPERALLREQIVSLEETVAEKPLAAQASLQPWVAPLFVEGPKPKPIDADYRLALHDYLDKLPPGDLFKKLRSD